MVVITKNGYGQVEPNHLAAQRTGQIYAQLPVQAETLVDLATPGIVQNGMFLDYDYAKNAVVSPNFGGSKLTMLVMNEIRTYADFLTPKDYAQIATGTTAGIGLSNEAPIRLKSATLVSASQSGSTGVTRITVDPTGASNITTGSVISFTGLVGELVYLNGTFTVATNGGNTSTFSTAGTISGSTTVSGVTTTSTILVSTPGDTQFNTVYPRLYKIEPGDIITTNLVDTSDYLVGDLLTPGTNGLLQKTTSTTASVLWKVASITTTPDLQPALKLQCVSGS